MQALMHAMFAESKPKSARLAANRRLTALFRADRGWSTRSSARSTARSTSRRTCARTS